MPTLAPDEQTALQDTLHRLLADHSSEAHVRRTMESASGYDADLWQLLAEMGIVGLLADEAHGGTGAGPVEIERVMEEVGASLLCSPLLASSVLAVGLLRACGDEAAQARLLPDIAKGALIATVALTGDSGSWTPDGVDVIAQPPHQGAAAQEAATAWSLSGHASFVAHAQNAGVVLIVARCADSFGIFEVRAANATGMAVTALPTFDHTLRLARIEFAATPARLIGAANAGWGAVESALNLARVALAGEQAGGARRMLEITVEYAKHRVQFGRAIGSFQAIKHMAADLLLESESATSAARHAARALADAAPGADAAVSLAAFACAEAFTTVTATSVQMHGGIAFTWEHPAHLYLRRARADAQLFGTPAYYRERYLQQLGA